MSLRISAILTAFVGVQFLGGPKSVIGFFPAALFLIGAVGLYLGRRDGATVVLVMFILWTVLVVLDFTPPHTPRMVAEDVMALVVVIYVPATIVYHWRQLRSKSSRHQDDDRRIH
jgi:hypothetical protein